MAEEKDLLGAPFLMDPEAKYGAIWSPNAKRLDQLQHHPLLLLVGERDSGKSTAIDDYIT